MATLTIAGANVRGSLKGQRSAFQTKAPMVLMLKCPDGKEPADYQLVALTIRGDNREYQSGKVGLRTKIGVDDKDLIPVRFEPVGPNIFKATLTQLPVGEYGLLQIDSTTPNSAGKLYTFGISQ